MARTLPGLDPTTVGIDSPVHLSQRFLSTAYDSVSSLIEQSYPALRAQRTGGRGRLTHAEHDLFRAAVVFAGAGVDAVLKQALRSCVPIQIDKSDAAREKYLDFVAGHVQEGQGVNPRQLARLLVEPNPHAVLQDRYVDVLTGSSLQAQQQVTAALAALGLQDHRDLFVDSKSLNPLFKARNQISHEMDMTSAAVKARGKRSRHERALSTYVSMCHGGLNYCQRVLNRLDDELS